MNKIEELIDMYVKYYKELGPKSRINILIKVINKIETICREDRDLSQIISSSYINQSEYPIKLEWMHYARTGLGILMKTFSTYIGNEECCRLKCLEMILRKINMLNLDEKQDELLSLFENVMNINPDNFKDKFSFYSSEFDANLIAQSQISILIVMYALKEFDRAIELDDNYEWEHLMEKLIDGNYICVNSPSLSDDFRQKYISNYYRKVNDVFFLGERDSIDTLLQYFDNPTVKHYLYNSKKRLTENQLMYLLSKTNLDELYMIFYAPEEKINSRREMINRRLKDVYSSEVADKITNVFMSLFGENIRKQFSELLSDQERTIRMIETIERISPVFDTKSFKVASYYPELIDSIESFDDLDEENIILLKKVASLPRLIDKPKSLDELKRIISNHVVAFEGEGNKIKGDRFQPDDSGLDGNFGGPRVIRKIDRSGNTIPYGRGSHYELVSVVYNLPLQEDYFHILVQKAREGYVTIISEGSMAWIYIPFKISNKQIEAVEKVLDGNKISNSNATFAVIQAKEEVPDNDRENDYFGYEGTDENPMRRSDLMVILNKNMEQEIVEEQGAHEDDHRID